ncbi:hypothetical protein [Wolbachia endosymbiont of Cylisticus convexus]|uniref:hypothetical protein n=1 Tax=Wolbachia endosymbiont of Cylisticus convexus TaxID=118728 RepID=UPI001F2ED751|nr:hypothetical protein [Wolbachia endosymbiont of Cylisticus convexus]
MVMTYEQWQIILGVIDQEVNLSKDNVVEKIKKDIRETKGTRDTRNIKNVRRGIT